MTTVPDRLEDYKGRKLSINSETGKAESTSLGIGSNEVFRSTSLLIHHLMSIFEEQ